MNKPLKTPGPEHYLAFYPDRVDAIEVSEG